MKNSRRTKRILIIVAGTIVLVVATILGIDPLVERAVRSVLERTEKSGHEVHFDRLHTNILDRRLRMSGLSIVPSEELLGSDSSLYFHIAADTVELHGVALRKLIFQRILHVGRISVNSPKVKHSYASSERPKSRDDERDATNSGSDTKVAGLSLLRLDTLIVTRGSGTSTDRGGGRADLSVQRLDLLTTGILVTQTDSGTLHFMQSRTKLALDGIQLGMDPFYTLAIGKLRLDLPADSLLLTGLQLIPEVEPTEYHKLVDEQIEHYALNIDTAAFVGFDLTSNLRHGAIIAQHVAVSGMEFTIHRDKSIPMGAFKHQPLPSHIILELDIPVSFGTIEGRNAKVSYSERTERGVPYGTISFTGIDATITGVDNTYNADPPDLHLKGTARLAGHGQAKLDMRLPMDPDRATVELHAELRNVPFEVLNRMTSNLVHVRATEGTIHRVDMHMQGNDTTATGTVEVMYEDLQLVLNRSVDGAKVLTLLANTVVRKTNMPEDKRYRKGEFLAYRDREKGIFNFLWRGMKEGMMDVMLPPMLMKQIRKDRDKQH